MNKSSVLFICTANLCRSPMAEAFFKKIVSDHPANRMKWEIGSAGTWAQPGLPAAAYAQKVMRTYGLSIEAHRSRIVDRSILTESALVLTMESGHQEALRNEFPEEAGKIFMLSEMSGVQISIADPDGASYHTYEQVAGNIFEWLTKGKEKIFQLAMEN